MFQSGYAVLLSRINFHNFQHYLHHYPFKRDLLFGAHVRLNFARGEVARPHICQTPYVERRGISPAGYEPMAKLLIASCTMPLGGELAHRKPY
jgi:hypothetical protein